MSTLAAGEIRTRPFNDHPWLIIVASLLLHAGVIALLMLFSLPDVRFPKPPAAISITFVPPTPMPVQPPAPVTVPVPSPTPTPVTAAPAATTQMDDQTALQNAQAFAQMMQQATQVKPMTVLKPTPAPTPPAAEAVLHTEGGTSSASSDRLDGGGQTATGDNDSPASAMPAGAGNLAGGAGNTGSLGGGGTGTFAEYIVINVDGAYRSRGDPQLQHFTDRLIACGLHAFDSDNHNWMVELDVSFRPDGLITDMRLHPPATPSAEHAQAAQDLMSILRMPGCGKLNSSIFMQQSWHTGEIYLFPLDNPNVPFNLKPQSMTPFTKTTRLTPQ